MPIVYASRVFAVEELRVELPNGSVHDVAIVRHPPSVVLIPVQDDGRVVLIRQYRPSLGTILWELPAGSVNPGETPESAAARECEEEIGLFPHAVERLRGMFPAPGFCDEELIFFRVSGLRTPAADSPHRPDEDEDIVPVAMALDEARALVAGGEIVDLKTAYGLTLL
jgi:8-oxo-dGTP pyrophosphatase MutT (NUDIX family)